MENGGGMEGWWGRQGSTETGKDRSMFFSVETLQDIMKSLELIGANRLFILLYTYFYR